MVRKWSSCDGKINCFKKRERKLLPMVIQIWLWNVLNWFLRNFWSAVCNIRNGSCRVTLMVAFSFLPRILGGDRSYEWCFFILWIQVEWWGHSKPTHCDQIYLNFLHSEAVGMLKHIPSVHSHPPFSGCYQLLLSRKSWNIEAFSLCMFLTSTKLSEWSPMEQRAPAQGSSWDQCTWGPSSGTTRTQFLL